MLMRLGRLCLRNGGRLYFPPLPRPPSRRRLGPASRFPRWRFSAMASSLTSDQIAAAAAAVARWLRTMAQGERGVGEAALVRLAAGARPPAPPPPPPPRQLPPAGPPPLAHSSP